MPMPFHTKRGEGAAAAAATDAGRAALGLLALAPQTSIIAYSPCNLANTRRGGGNVGTAAACPMGLVGSAGTVASRKMMAYALISLFDSAM